MVTGVALFLLSHSPNNPSTHRRLLQLSSNSTLSASHSHHQLEKQHIHHSHPEHVDDEWEEDKFNVTNRIVRLFPEIDVEPTDWFVSLHELTQWNLQLAQREVLHRGQREMDFHDENHDGFVSFSEYGPPSWVQNAADSEEHFNASDADGEGFVNLSEFNENLSDSELLLIIGKLHPSGHYYAKQQAEYIISQGR